MLNRSEKTKVVAQPNSMPVRGVLLGSALVVTGALWANQALAQDEGVTVAHGYSTFGELKYGADFEHLDYVNPDAPKGGEISIWFQGTFDNMNPYATKEGRPGVLSTIGTERIFQSVSDEVGASYCYLCTTIEYPEDRSWVQINLRDDVTFSDGTPMTAHDVVFSQELLIEQGTESYATVIREMFPVIEVVDDYTFRIEFGEDFSPNDTISQAGAIPVFSKAWYEETGARLDESRFEPGPGTGAYMLESYDVNRQIIYSKVDDWWGTDVPLNRGRNNFDSIRIEYFADTTAAFEGFKAGEFTFRQENSSLTWATQYDFPALENGWVVREELSNGALPRATGFVFNMGAEKFQDLRVRQAIALMYNFTWTNDTLQYGLFSQRESFWQNSDMQATGVAEGLELELLQSVADMIDPEIVTGEVTVPHTSGESQIDRGNLRQALALMEDAGWIAGDDGLLRKDGEVFELEFLSVSPTLDRIILPYIDNLKRMGIEATYNRVDPAQYTQRTNVFDFDMTLDSYTNGLEEGESLGQRYGSDGVGDVFNPAQYTNPAVDALIPAVAAAETREEMTAAVRAIDRIMRNDLFVIPVWYLSNHWVAYWDMYEHPEELPPYALGHLDFWWYNAEGHEALRAAGALR